MDVAPLGLGCFCGCIFYQYAAPLGLVRQIRHWRYLGFHRSARAQLTYELQESVAQPGFSRAQSGRLAASSSWSGCSA